MVLYGLQCADEKKVCVGCYTPHAHLFFGLISTCLSSYLLSSLCRVDKMQIIDQHDDQRDQKIQK